MTQMCRAVFDDASGFDYCKNVVKPLIDARQTFSVHIYDPVTSTEI